MNKKDMGDIAKTDAAIRTRPKLSELVELRCKGWTMERIGKFYGVSHQCVSTRLRAVPDLLDVDANEVYTKNRVDLLTGMERQILCWLSDPNFARKASWGNLAYGFTQIHQARRLEAGASTANVALHAIVEAVEKRLSAGEDSRSDHASRTHEIEPHASD